jgi:hypothetical protein
LFKKKLKEFETLWGFVFLFFAVCAIL